ncbi:PREDICTED: aldose 1-epimerase-like [Dufourea novaeangliae]|uniref:aldose 1-epimerase-like n=1 Tax=Dufourea novaeangliae TaxID=178035 RepID=UPI000767D9F7|nr:PREDICTED: aldose 1-epimerase-like [Dufourea novaeangliae]
MSIRDTFIEEDGFGIVPRPNRNKHNGKFDIVRRYTLTNKHKASVQLISWGAGIQSIKIPNKSGILGDIVLGFDDLEGYLKNRYIGSIIGRVVNRISGGKMTVNNKVHQLSVNDKNGYSHFNGGIFGFDNVNWQSHILDKYVVMSHCSRAHGEGYPGDMLTQVKYSWTDDNQLHINIRATATEPTPANITTNCLMNLAGHATGPIELKKHVVAINAGSWTFADVKDNLPTGAIFPVDRTVYDLRLPTQLTKNRLYNVPGGGYNQNLCVTSPSCWSYRFHARVLHPGSGRTLEVYSNQPGLQFTTGNDLTDPERIYPPDFDDFCDCDNEDFATEYEEEPEIWGKDGVRYQRHGGFTLSPQNYPDAINISDFPCSVLYPGKVYTHDITYKFGLLSKI